jgi:hypothetical protein
VLIVSRAFVKSNAILTTNRASDWEVREWLAKTVLLTTVHEAGSQILLDKYWRSTEVRFEGPFTLGPDPPQDAARTVIQLAAEYDEDRTFRLAQGQTVAPLCVKAAHPLRTGYNGPLYLPVHRACLEIAARFIHHSNTSRREADTTGSTSLTSVHRLWELLYLRLPGIADSMSRTLREPHDYLGGDSCRNLDWEPENDVEYGTVRSLARFRKSH